jgi:hypothetical protein
MGVGGGGGGGEGRGGGGGSDTRKGREGYRGCPHVGEGKGVQMTKTQYTALTMLRY